MSAKSLIFAIDFDGTIVDDEFPEIGKIKPHAVRVIKRLQAKGHKIILWTCRKNETNRPYLSEAVFFVEDNGILLDTVNSNINPNLPFANPKVLADFYLDDRSFPPFPGWEDFEHGMEQMGIL